MSQKTDETLMLNDWTREDAISMMEWSPGSPGSQLPRLCEHESLSKSTHQNETPFGNLDTPMTGEATIPLSGVGVTQTRAPGPLGQFQKHFTKPLVPFLTMVYLHAESILQAARSVHVFHMQSLYIARQALHLVILLNDLVDPENGPDDTQQAERIDLEDDLIELLEAIEQWGARGEGGGSADSEQRLLKIQHQYTQIFKERFYFHDVRDYANDIIYQKLLTYDKGTIEKRQRRQIAGNIVQVDYWIGHVEHYFEDQEAPEATPEIRTASSTTLVSIDDVIPFSGYASASPIEAVGYSPLETSTISIDERNSRTKTDNQKPVPHFRPPPYNPLRDMSETPLLIQNKSTEDLTVGAHDGDVPTAHGQTSHYRDPSSPGSYSTYHPSRKALTVTSNGIIETRGARNVDYKSVPKLTPAQTADEGDRAPISRMRHSRRGSNTAAAVTSPLMNPNLPSSTTSGRVSSSRPKRRDIPDAPRHARRISRSQSALMAAAATQLSMDVNPMWKAQTHLNGHGIRYDPVNMAASETPAGHAPYAYDAGRPHLAYPSAPVAAGARFPAPGLSANSRRLNPGIGATSVSPYSTRSTIGVAGSLQRSPASTRADPLLDSQVYSHNQHSDHYGHIDSGSQYVQEFDYTRLAQPTHIDSMSANLQRHPHADAIYTPEPHDQYYHSSHSHSPASPRLAIRLAPHQAIYHHSDAAPNIAGNPFMTVDEIVKLNQVSYLPPQNHHLQSPISAVSPSEMSEPPERRSPTPQSRSRVPGQRIDVDRKMLENSFRGNDDQSRVRRDVLNDIQRQPWFHSDQDEPKMDVHLHREILKHGLGVVERSIYTVFLVEDKDSNQWRCLFGSEEMSCKKSEKRFERVERAIEHVRSHLGHRPFACDGTCHKSKSTGINCGKRFFAAGYLEDHKKRPQKRANGP